VLFDPRLEFRVVLYAAGLLVQHGFGLRLHRVRIAQPFDQAFGTDVIAGLCTLHGSTPIGSENRVVLCNPLGICETSRP